MSHCFVVWFVGCPSDCRRPRLFWMKRLTTRFDQCRKTRSHTAAPHALRLTVDNQPVRSIHAPAAAVWHCNTNVTHVYDVSWRNRLIKQCEVWFYVIRSTNISFHSILICGKEKLIIIFEQFSFCPRGDAGALSLRAAEMPGCYCS